MSDDLCIGSFCSDPPFSSPFPYGDKPTHIKNFLHFLEEQGVTSTKLANHKVMRVPGEGDVEARYKIEAEQEAVFRGNKAFPPSRPKPNLRNAGAMISPSLIKESKHIRVVHQFVCAPRKHIPTRSFKIKCMAVNRSDVHAGSCVNDRYIQKQQIIKPKGIDIFLAKPVRLLKGAIAPLAVAKPAGFQIAP